MKKEMVNHPDHYNAGSMEVIEAIDGLGYAEGFCVGSIIKYVTRYKHKNGVEDLKKAKWYLEKLIEKTKPKTIDLIYKVQFDPKLNFRLN